MNQKEEQLNQQKELIVTAIKMLLSGKMALEQIAQNLNVDVEFIKAQM